MIAVDFGTCNSSVGVFNNGSVEVIVNEDGNRQTPCVIAVDHYNLLVGDAALYQMSQNPLNTIHSIKKFVGVDFDDPQVQESIRSVAYRVQDGDNKPRVAFKKNGSTESPEEIMAIVLRHMKQLADGHLGLGHVKKCVVTVPSCFDYEQRLATIDAAKRAGFDAIRLLNETTAAGLAYVYDKNYGKIEPEELLIVDLGGGYCQASVMRVDDGMIQVKATTGLNTGGDDVTLMMAKQFAEDFKRKFGWDSMKDEKAFRRLNAECESVKKRLSTDTTTYFDTDSLIDGIDYEVRVSRDAMDQILSEFYKSIQTMIKKVLKDVNMWKSSVTHVVLVGGTSRLPGVKNMIQEMFGKSKVSKGLNPQEAVVIGASIYGQFLQNPDDPFIRGTISGVHDVTPLLLVTDIVDDPLAIIFERNAKLPAELTKKFKTNADHETSIGIMVYQGQHKSVKTNRMLAALNLTGIPDKKEGEADVRVTFKINTDGMIEVKAQCESDDGLRHPIAITNSKLNRGQLVSQFNEDNEDDDCVICIEPLSAAPSIQQACGHVFHYHCCKNILIRKWPDARITFNFALCPVCKEPMNHPLVKPLLVPIEAIRDEIKRKAAVRIEYDGLKNDPMITNPESPFHKNPLAYAMEKYAYYMCFKCGKPYYGGDVRCDPGGAGGDEQHDPKTLICGGCSDVSRSQDCPKHGKEFLSYKCQFCCSIAVFFCFGKYHFCNTCHNNHGRLIGAQKSQMAICPAGPGSVQLAGGECPLRVKHAPTGETFSLGCGVCLNAHTF